MKTISQRNDLDCGVATAATITGQSYARAFQAHPHPETARGTSVPDMEEILLRLTGSKWTVSKRHYNRPLAEYELTKPEMILIRRNGTKLGHWVATDGSRIFDPALDGPYPPKRYQKKNWLVIRLVFQKERQTSSTRR